MEAIGQDGIARAAAVVVPVIAARRQRRMLLEGLGAGPGSHLSGVRDGQVGGRGTQVLQPDAGVEAAVGVVQDNRRKQRGRALGGGVITGKLSTRSDFVDDRRQRSRGALDGGRARKIHGQVGVGGRTGVAAVDAAIGAGRDPGQGLGCLNRAVALAIGDGDVGRAGSKVEQPDAGGVPAIGGARDRGRVKGATRPGGGDLYRRIAGGIRGIVRRELVDERDDRLIARDDSRAGAARGE